MSEAPLTHASCYHCGWLGLIAEQKTLDLGFGRYVDACPSCRLVECEYKTTDEARKELEENENVEFADGFLSREEGLRRTDNPYKVVPEDGDRGWTDANIKRMDDWYQGFDWVHTK